MGPESLESLNVTLLGAVALGACLSLTRDGFRFLISAGMVVILWFSSASFGFILNSGIVPEGGFRELFSGDLEDYIVKKLSYLERLSWLILRVWSLGEALGSSCLRG